MGRANIVEGSVPWLSLDLFGNILDSTNIVCQVLWLAALRGACMWMTQFSGTLWSSRCQSPPILVLSPWFGKRLPGYLPPPRISGIQADSYHFLANQQVVVQDLATTGLRARFQAKASQGGTWWGQTRLLASWQPEDLPLLGSSCLVATLALFPSWLFGTNLISFLLTIPTAFPAMLLVHALNPLQTFQIPPGLDLGRTWPSLLSFSFFLSF